MFKFPQSNIQGRRNSYRLRKVSLTFLFILLGTAPLFAWNEGFFTLVVPNRMESPVQLQVDIEHRFLQLEPLHGANVYIAGSIAAFDHARFTAAYLTKTEEIDLGLAGWLPLGPFKTGLQWDLALGRDLTFADYRYVSQIFTLFSSAEIVPTILTTVLNVQYDVYHQNFNTALGLGLSIIPDLLSIESEIGFSPSLTSAPPPVNTALFWTAGVLVKTAGHQFMVFVGNGNDLRVHSALESLKTDPENFTIGFVLRRKFDID